MLFPARDAECLRGIEAAPSEAKKRTIAAISEGSSKRLSIVHLLCGGFKASSTVVPSCSANLGIVFELWL